MATGASQNLKARKFLFVLLLIVIAAAVVYTVLQNRPWTVPAEAKQRKNPLTRSEAILQSIRPLYNDKCASCHGNSGKGDGHDATLYDPAPTNFADPKRMSGVTDGELLQTQRGPQTHAFLQEAPHRRPALAAHSAPAFLRRAALSRSRRKIERSTRYIDPAAIKFLYSDVHSFWSL